MAAYGIKLTRFGPLPTDPILYAAHRMRIEASNPVGWDGKPFVYRRGPIHPDTLEPIDTFFAIAGPADVAEYPVDEPDPDKRFPFFRVGYVELDFRASSLADEGWVAIHREVELLIEAFERFDNLVAALEVQIGESGDESTSDSTSS